MTTACACAGAASGVPKCWCRARVQHLDIERGPIERRYGLATLVVHTAGTRLSAVRQPGFDEDSANRLRDALVPHQREHDDATHG